MIHLSGTFAYQRPGFVQDDRREVFPAAMYIGMTLLHDDGTPVLGDTVDGLGNVRAIVTMSAPQQLVDSGQNDLPLDLNVDAIANGYYGLTAQIDLQAAGLPGSWLPLAVLIFVNDVPVGIITAALEPMAVTGIAPPINPSPIFEP